jgi:hypothetical protein
LKGDQLATYNKISTVNRESTKKANKRVVAPERIRNGLCREDWISFKEQYPSNEENLFYFCAGNQDRMKEE